MMKLLLTFICVFFLLGLLTAAQAVSVHVSEGWFATISNYIGYEYEPAFDDTQGFYWQYVTWEGFWPNPEYCLVTTSSVLTPRYIPPYDTWSNFASGVSIDMHDGWVDTTSDRVTIRPAVLLGDEHWYHISFDWSTSWTDSPAAGYLTLEMWAGQWHYDYEVAWHVTPGPGFNEGHVDMDVPLTYISPPEFALSFNPVPEPSSILALLCGLSSVVALARRRALRLG